METNIIPAQLDADTDVVDTTKYSMENNIKCIDFFQMEIADIAKELRQMDKLSDEYQILRNELQEMTKACVAEAAALNSKCRALGM
jgi:FtsZ-binding cell division protein ZapB